MVQIMVVEDEKSIRSFIVLNLKHAGFEVYEAESGEKAWQILQQDQAIQLLLLDVMLPGISGFDLCRKIRETNQMIGIILLTARVMETDKVSGLRMGADDYITKPFSPAEMIARVKSLLRRMRTNVDTVPPRKRTILVSGPFKLSLEDERFFKGDQLIELTPTEFELVKILIENKNRLLTRDELLDDVWGANFVGDTKIVDVNIRRLRQKIEENPSKPFYIKTHWGRGYIWNGTEP